MGRLEKSGYGSQSKRKKRLSRADSRASSVSRIHRAKFQPEQKVEHGDAYLYIAIVILFFILVAALVHFVFSNPFNRKYTKKEGEKSFVEETHLKANEVIHSIMGLKLWLDASDIDGDGVMELDQNTIRSRVTSWHDKSGKGSHFVQHNDKHRPMLMQTNKDQYARLHFDGKDDFMQTRSSILDMSHQDFSIVFVIKSQSGGTLLCKEDGDNQMGIGEKELWLGDGVTRNINGQVPSFAGNENIYSIMDGEIQGLSIVLMEWDYDVIKPASIKWYVNGKFHQQKLLNDRYEIEGQIDNKLFIGKKLGYSGGNYNGEIGEVIIYDHVLSYKERNLLTSYLSYKWKIPLQKK